MHRSYFSSLSLCLLSPSHTSLSLSLSLSPPSPLATLSLSLSLPSSSLFSFPFPAPLLPSFLAYFLPPSLPPYLSLASRRIFHNPPPLLMRRCGPKRQRNFPPKAPPRAAPVPVPEAEAPILCLSVLSVCCKPTLSSTNPKQSNTAQASRVALPFQSFPFPFLPFPSLCSPSPFYFLNCSFLPSSSSSSLPVSLSLSLSLSRSLNTHRHHHTSPHPHQLSFLPCLLRRLALPSLPIPSTTHLPPSFLRPSLSLSLDVAVVDDFSTA
ncbi:hypothetical protein Mapa_016406 [Marchantia paleacea]|nr:hypothetical protein Mapa_016406 [Marchantia paleacea]